MESSKTMDKHVSLNDVLMEANFEVRENIGRRANFSYLLKGSLKSSFTCKEFITVFIPLNTTSEETAFTVNCLMDWAR